MSAERTLCEGVLRACFSEAWNKSSSTSIRSIAECRAYDRVANACDEETDEWSSREVSSLN